MKLQRTQNWTLEPMAPIAPQITRIVRERIILNDLQPGDRISESEIARTYAVSRQPVREAFIRLANEGLLEVRPQRGTFVSRIGYLAVLDARFLRESIEADIVKILAARRDPALIDQLNRQLDQQRAMNATDQMAFIELDEEFHRTLADAAGKATAWKQIEGLKSQMDRVRYLALSQIPIEKLVSQHATVIQTIRNGDVSAANAAIRIHLREVLRDLPKIISANRDFFDVPDGDLPSPITAPIQGYPLAT